MPFFAIDNYDNIDFAYTDNNEFGPTGANSQTITVKYPLGQWSYFGCLLNVYDPTNVYSNQQSITSLLPGTHHCLVARIAYDDAPIQNPPGAIAAPGKIDKLAQRSLLRRRSQVLLQALPQPPLSRPKAQILRLSQAHRQAPFPHRSHHKPRSGAFPIGSQPAPSHSPFPSKQTTMFCRMTRRRYQS